PGLQNSVVFSYPQVLVIQYAQQVEAALLRCGRKIARRVEVQNGCRAAAQIGSLKLRAEKACAPVDRAAVDQCVLLYQHAETWKIGIFGAQTVEQPRAERWETLLGGAGVQLKDRRRVTV